MSSGEKIRKRLHMEMIQRYKYKIDTIMLFVYFHLMVFINLQIFVTNCKKMAKYCLSRTSRSTNNS